ncbi:hypothetical protein SAMN05216296_2426 [Pseudomonas pohangensis]|uniref:Uncharacterized protein n=1 Tax=Pseudomonas pohangensis TaxID=364197 RepID=A0A1H2GNR8_9PSED|nr:hypothetical protein [Pseudomonas pohangensis]SDU21204.1 hypothetical protein SAMN05216296_2426 [Pseudomonas pohangensis]
MKKFFLIFLITAPVNAEEYPPQVVTPPARSTSYYSSDGYTYGSDGSAAIQSGNTTYIAPPVSSGTGGTTYMQSGNTTYGSDGSVTVKGAGITNYYAPSGSE